MEQEFIDMMAYTVSVAPFASDDKYGAPTYGTAVDYDAAIEQKVRQVRDFNGQERVSTTRVFLNTVTAISPKDKLTLPSGFTPQTPPIISVGRVSDEGGVHHCEVYL